jgi:hypothetical protein
MRHSAEPDTDRGDVESPAPTKSRLSNQVATGQRHLQGLPGGDLPLPMPAPPGRELCPSRTAMASLCRSRVGGRAAQESPGDRSRWSRRAAPRRASVMRGNVAPTLAPTRRSAKINNTLNWSGWRDSNPRPPAPKAGALTKLRYIPCDVPCAQCPADGTI